MNVNQNEYDVQSKIYTLIFCCLFRFTSLWTFSFLKFSLVGDYF